MPTRIFQHNHLSGRRQRTLDFLRRAGQEERGPTGRASPSNPPPSSHPPSRCTAPPGPRESSGAPRTLGSARTDSGGPARRRHEVSGWCQARRRPPGASSERAGGPRDARLLVSARGKSLADHGGRDKWRAGDPEVLPHVAVSTESRDVSVAQRLHARTGEAQRGGVVPGQAGPPDEVTANAASPPED